MEPIGDNFEISVSKVIVFKKRKHSYIRNNAQYKVKLLSVFRSYFYENSRNIIDENGEKKNQNVDRNESHIKNTAGRQKQEPSQSVRQ